MTAQKEPPPKVDYVEFAKTMTNFAVANALPKPSFVNIPRITPLEAIITWGMAAKSVLSGDKK